jgi:hypothetical protein
MELHAQIRSADTDTDVDEQTGLMGIQLSASELRPPTRDRWQQEWTASNARFDRVFLPYDIRRSMDCT